LGGIAAYGGGVAESIVNPIVLAVTLAAGLLILVLPRRKAIIPFVFFGILIPINQIVVVGGLHFPMLRVLALFGFARILWAKLSGHDKIFSGGMNGIDKALVLLTAFTAIDGILLWRVWGEVVYQLGVLYTAFGVYFLLRFLIRDQEDIERALRVLACVTVVVAGFMIYESATGRNLFYAILGGAQAAMLATASVRADSFRAQGCFGHPIIAGTFGGFMVPLFVGWWKLNKKHRKVAVCGAIAAAVIPFAVGSSTALFVFIAGAIALLMWPLRRKMRMIRWGIVGIIVGLDVVMKAPVWELIARVHLADGSSSWHREELVNQCIRHFAAWALIGTKSFASWGWEMGDLANQYVATADTSGLIPLIAFIALLVYSCKYIGRARQYFEGDKQREFFAWAVGCSLFANLVGFFGIGYWDQIIVPWYGLLAIISALSLAARVHAAEAVSDTLGAHKFPVRLSPTTIPAASKQQMKTNRPLNSVSHWRRKPI
jgi:hypothetical protein